MITAISSGLIGPFRNIEGTTFAEDIDLPLTASSNFVSSDLEGCPSVFVPVEF